MEGNTSFDSAAEKKKLLAAEADEVEKKLRVDAHVARYLEPMEKAFGIQADIVDTLVDGKSVWVVMQHPHHGQFTMVIHPSPEEGATLSDHSGGIPDVKVTTPAEAEQVFLQWVGKTKLASDWATATSRALATEGKWDEGLLSWEQPHLQVKLDLSSTPKWTLRHRCYWYEFDTLEALVAQVKESRALCQRVDETMDHWNKQGLMQSTDLKSALAKVLFGSGFIEEVDRAEYKREIEIRNGMEVRVAYQVPIKQFPVKKEQEYALLELVGKKKLRVYATKVVPVD